MYKGEMFRVNSRFLPSSAFNHTGGDIQIVFLSGNGVVFAGESKDVWYRATRPFGNLGNTKNSWKSSATYIFKEAASPLGCVQQFQWCNPEYPIPEGCGPLASSLDAFEGAFPLFNLTMEDWISDESLFAHKGLISNDERGSRLLWPFMVDATTTAGVEPFLAAFGANLLQSVLASLGLNPVMNIVSAASYASPALHLTGLVGVRSLRFLSPLWCLSSRQRRCSGTYSSITMTLERPRVLGSAMEPPNRQSQARRVSAPGGRR